VQEHLTSQVTTELQRVLKLTALAVMIEADAARHVQPRSPQTEK
jgi:hypothetical protein